MIRVGNVILLTSSVPILYSWSGVNIVGATKKKATLAFMSMGYALGHTCGPFMFMPSSSPQSSSTIIRALLSLHVLFIILVLVLRNHFSKMNRQYCGSVKVEQIIGSYNPRLYVTIDFDQQEKVYETEFDGNDKPSYKFSSQIWDDSTDPRNKEFRFLL